MAKHNGWNSYETWLANMWISNSYGDDKYWSDEAEAIADEYDIDKESGCYSDATVELAQRMKSCFDDNFPELDGFWIDLLLSAFQAIDWREIAEHYIDSAIENREVLEDE